MRLTHDQIRWLTPQIELAIASGWSADDFLRGRDGRTAILAVWRQEVKELYGQIAKERVVSAA